MHSDTDFSGVYQDVLINGELVYKGRECAKRLEMIQPYINNTDTVLDIGSHSGYFAIELAKRGCTVTSYEPVKKMYDIQMWAAKENGVSLRAHNKDFTSTPAKYDVVLLLSVLQYFDMDKFLLRIGKIGKRIIIEFPIPDEIEALYIDKINRTHPFDEYLKRFFSKVELIGRPEAPYMKDITRKMWLCEK